MLVTNPRDFTRSLEFTPLLRLARLTLWPVLALGGLALGTGTARAEDLIINNGSSSNFSSGNNSYGAISVGTSEGVVDGNTLTVVNTNTVLPNTSGSNAHWTVANIIDSSQTTLPTLPT